jgi:DNA-binding NtrC family response regulator
MFGVSLTIYLEEPVMAKILLLQPVTCVQDALTEILSKSGHEVTGVEKLSHVVEELSNYRYELVICEGTIERKGDGADLAQQLALQFKREGWPTKAMIYSHDIQNIRDSASFYSPTDICQSLAEAVENALKN